MPKFAGVIPRFPVKDLDLTLEFYLGHLGFAVDVLWPSPVPTFAILRRDDTALGFFEPTEHQPGPIGYAELCIETDDARALHERLQQELPVEWGPEVYSYGRREFAVRDPNGYLLIFTEPTTDPPTTNEPGE